MFCLKFSKSAPPYTISNVLFPPAAYSPFTTPGISKFASVEQSWHIRRSLTAKQYLSCLPLQRLPSLLDRSQDLSAQNTTRKGIYHRVGPFQSTLSTSRLASLRTLPFFSSLAFTQSSFGSCLKHNIPCWRSHATAHDPAAVFLQPLDPLCRRQSIGRGIAISLPILLIYLLLFLLNFVSQQSKLGREYTSIVTRFCTYRRHEGLQNVVSLVISQFTHSSSIRLAIDSLVLIGVASLLGSVFNRRTFFVVYVLGGFLAAAADCAWARFTNPCRNPTQAQIDQINTSVCLINEAGTKLARLSPVLQISTMKDLVKYRTDLGRLVNSKEFSEQVDIFKKHVPLVRDWVRWSRPNWAASGSLVCLRMPSTR